MTRSLIAFGIVAALLSVGCVPVTEPAGAVEKAEPDKELVGKWAVQKGNGIGALIKPGVLTIDAPEVKGNPEGLMRGVTNSEDGTESEVWFFSTKIGAHTYVSLIFGAKADKEPPRFSKEGTFADWTKKESKAYLVFGYTRDGDKLTLVCGNNEVFNKLMKDEKIKGDGNELLELYSTPAGWFAEYFGKNSPDKVFDGTNTVELKREKK